jgi:hypothetical protein
MVTPYLPDNRLAGMGFIIACVGMHHALTQILPQNDA